MAIATVPKAPAPISTPISDTDRRGRLTGYVPVPWSDYFNSVDAQLGGSYLVLDHQQIVSGHASIGSTPITSQILPAGLFRISYYLVELQAASGNSSISVSVTWIDRSVVRTQTSQSLTANSRDVALGNVFMVRCDRATPIQYSVAYTSTGTTPMLYGLDILLEQVHDLPQ